MMHASPFGETSFGLKKQEAGEIIGEGTSSGQAEAMGADYPLPFG